MVELKGDERLDYLLAEDMRIIQSPSVFAFSLDAVLLAKFVYVPIQRGKLVDLCSGNGVIPLFLSTRTKGTITGVEIQKRLYDMAVRSISYNHLSDRIHMIHGDIKEIHKTIGHDQYDVVTCNPPYFPTPSKREMNENEHLAIARHEILCTLDDAVRASSILLKQGGKAAFVHRSGRLIDMITTMRKYKIRAETSTICLSKGRKRSKYIIN